LKDAKEELHNALVLLEASLEHLEDGHIDFASPEKLSPKEYVVNLKALVEDRLSMFAASYAAPTQHNGAHEPQADAIGKPWDGKVYYGQTRPGDSKREHNIVGELVAEMTFHLSKSDDFIRTAEQALDRYDIASVLGAYAIAGLKSLKSALEGGEARFVAQGYHFSIHRILAQNNPAKKGGDLAELAGQISQRLQFGLLAAAIEIMATEHYLEMAKTAAKDSKTKRLVVNASKAMSRAAAIAENVRGEPYLFSQKIVSAISTYADKKNEAIGNWLGRPSPDPDGTEPGGAGAGKRRGATDAPEVAVHGTGIDDGVPTALYNDPFLLQGQPLPAVDNALPAAAGMVSGALAIRI
jgi:hypothetical protein